MSKDKYKICFQSTFLVMLESPECRRDVSSQGELLTGTGNAVGTLGSTVRSSAEAAGFEHLVGDSPVFLVDEELQSFASG